MKKLCLAAFIAVSAGSVCWAEVIKYKGDFKAGRAESIAQSKPMVVIFGTNAAGKIC